MADEPRRSGRPTKGQHTKSLDQLDQPEPKKKSGKKAKKVAEVHDEEEEEVEQIRCVCGATETGAEDTEPWIACDKCLVWQHNVCVGVPLFDEDVPDKYLCEQCDPKAHKELLDGLKRGIYIWETRRKEYERGLEEAEAEKGSKKKGKKKGKRTSDPKVDHGHVTNGKAASPATPVVTDSKKKDVKTASAKRKARDDSHDKEALREPLPKSRKVTAQHTPHTPQPRAASPVSNLPLTISKLEGKERQGGAMLIQKALLHAIPVAISSKVYTLREKDEVSKKAERLAIQINDAVFSAYDPDKSAAVQQARILGHNLKSNQDLCNRVLSGSLAINSLAVMTSDDMASKELKQELRKMQAISDKQAIMVTDDGPRIRRTHKGEEVIEDDTSAVATDTTMSTSRRRSMLDPNADMATRSRENSPGDQVELPEFINDKKSLDDIRGQVAPKHPLNIETKQAPTRKPSAPSDFDINKVFNSVQSPTASQHIRRQSSNNVAPANGPGVDADIDRMLEDDEGNESPPYSPAEYDSDPSIIWRGAVAMESVAKFSAKAKHVAGVDIKTMPWSELLQKELKVAGRIDQEKANEYLCSLRYSPMTDVVVVEIEPMSEAAGTDFKSLYNYFNNKGKYGVLAVKGPENVRDTYLVPIPPSPANLPDFIINLEGHKIPDHRSNPMVLVALVVRSEMNETSRSLDNVEVKSPSLMSHAQRQMSLSGPGPAMSPIGPPQQSTFPNATPPPPRAPGNHAMDEVNRKQQEDRQREQDQRTGEAAAREILGDYVHAPTVAFLMPQAYQMRRVEWNVIRDILTEDERSRGDLQHLSQVLESRMSSQP